MRTWLICLSFVALIFLASDAAAQTDGGAYGIALLSIQPIDDAYVGSPYLSEGIGGIGPGFGGGLSVIAGNGFSIAGEYSTAHYEQIQDGRLVLGPFPLEHVPAETRLKDSLLTVLAGWATRGATTRVVFLGGVSLRLDRPTINDVEAEDYDNDDSVLPAFTGGVDLIHPLGARAQLLITSRYTFNERDTRLQYLGIGPHIIRVGAGVRIRLN